MSGRIVVISLILSGVFLAGMNMMISLNIYYMSGIVSAFMGDGSVSGLSSVGGVKVPDECSDLCDIYRAGLQDNAAFIKSIGDGVDKINAYIMAVSGMSSILFLILLMLLGIEKRRNRHQSNGGELK
jgi:hypothetical protein